MANVFGSDVHKQKYMEGVQDELRDSIPMQSVSTVITDNVEYIHNRYGDDESAENSSDSTYAVSDATYTDDAKLIDKTAVKSHRISYKDMARQGFDIAVDLVDRHGFALAEAVHRHSAQTVYQLANGIVDNEVLNGSASALTPITLSNTNVDDVGATITQVLQEREAYGGGTPFAMMSPKSAKKFNLFAMGAGFAVSDNALRDGLFRINHGHLFGLDTIITNEVPRSVDLTFSGQPSDADTFTMAINGTTVTFTLKNTPALAGAIDIGADAEGTIDNIVTAINAASGQGVTTGAGTTYIALSAANARLLKNAGVRAVKVSATVLRITTFRYVTIAESLTNVTLGTYIENILCGMRGAPVIALPSNGMHADETKPEGYLGKEITTSQEHDAHVFYKNRDKLVRLLVAA